MKSTVAAICAQTVLSSTVANSAPGFLQQNNYASHEQRGVYSGLTVDGSRVPSSFVELGMHTNDEKSGVLSWITNIFSQGSQEVTADAGQEIAFVSNPDQTIDYIEDEEYPSIIETGMDIIDSITDVAPTPVDLSIATAVLDTVVDGALSTVDALVLEDESHPTEEEFVPVEEPVYVEEPVIEEPTVEEPNIEEPIIEEPVIEEPVLVEEPAIIEDAPVEEPLLIEDEPALIQDEPALIEDGSLPQEEEQVDWEAIQRQQDEYLAEQEALQAQQEDALMTPIDPPMTEEEAAIAAADPATHEETPSVEEPEIVEPAPPGVEDVVVSSSSMTVESEGNTGFVQQHGFNVASMSDEELAEMQAALEMEMQNRFINSENSAIPEQQEEEVAFVQVMDSAASVDEHGNVYDVDGNLIHAAEDRI